jgi:hypothetical protein
MRDSKYSYNIITYVKNTETGGRWMHREARDSKTARRFSHVFLENDEGQYYYNDTRLVKVGADFIDENIFYVKYFRSLPQEDGQFSYLPKAPDGNVIVVKAITGNEAETLAARISKKSSEILASLRNRKVKYPGVTDKADIVPVRAFYRISVESGLLMEETYFNRAGKIISTPRKYDVIDTSFMPDADFFETPPGKIVIFPKNAEESWELIKKL